MRTRQTPAELASWRATQARYDTLTEKAAERRLVIVLADYAEARDDERSFTNTMGVGLTLLFTVLSAIVVLVTPALNGHSKPILSDWLLAGAPAVPLAILIFLQQQGTISTIRSYYLRSLEREIVLLDGISRKTLSGTYVQTILSHTSLRRGNARYRVLTLVLAAMVILLFGGVAVYVALSLHRGFKVLMAVAYLPPIALLLRENYMATVGGRATWNTLMKRRPHVPVPEHSAAATPRAQRSIVSYLLLPRIEELVKLSFLGMGFLYAALYRGAMDGRAWAALALGFGVFEYLFYEARYQWNDLRGAGEDQLHPYANQRGRLPLIGGSLRRTVAASGFVIVMRLVTAVSTCAAVALLVPMFRTLAIVLLIAGFVTLVVGGVYEALRSSDRHPRWVWSVVGLGYGVRLGLGALLVASVSSPPESASFIAWVLLPGVLFVTGWAVGTTSVLMTWALESTSWLYVKPAHIRQDAALQASIRSGADSATIRRRLRDDLLHSAQKAHPTLTKDHVLILDQRAAQGRSHIRDLIPSTDVGGAVPPSAACVKGMVSLTNFPVLKKSNGFTVWNRTAVPAAALTCGVSSFVGLAWGQPGPFATRSGQICLVAVLCSLFAMGFAWLAVTRVNSVARWAWWGTLTVVNALIVVTVGLILFHISIGRGAIVAIIAVGLPAFFYYFNYTMFRDASFDALKHPLAPLFERAKSFLVGQATLSEIRKSPMPPSGDWQA